MRCNWPAICLSLFWASLACGVEPRPAADEWRPIAVLSCASGDRLRDDLRWLGTLIDNDNFVPVVGKALGRMTGVTELTGLDQSRRIGAVIWTDGLAIEPVLLFPVTDAEALLKSLVPWIGTAGRVEADLFKIGSDDLTGYVRLRDGWAVVAQTAEATTIAPAITAFNEMPVEGDLALTIYAQRVPEAYRTMAIDYLRGMIREAAAAPPVANAPGGPLGAHLAIEQLRLIEHALTDVERASLVWSLDQADELTSLELTVDPLPGSPLAEAVAGLGAQRRAPRLADEKSALDLVVSWPLPTGQVERFEQRLSEAAAGLTGLLGEAPHVEHQALKAMLADMARGAVSTDGLELSLALVGARRPFTALATTRIEDRQKADALFEQWIRLAQPSGAGGEIEVRQLKGSRRAITPVPAMALRDPTIARLLPQVCGPDPKLHLAVAEDRLWMALGPQAATALDTAISAPARDVAPVQLTVRLGTLANLAALAIDDDNARSMLSLIALNLKAGDDQATLKLTGGQRLHVQLKAHDGLLRGAALGISLAALQALSR